MALVNIDEEIHKQVSKMVEEHRTEYPTIIFYVNRAIKNQLRIDLIASKEEQE
jgi:hypothetical protein